MATLDVPTLRDPSHDEPPATRLGRPVRRRRQRRARPDADWVVFAPIALYPLWWALGLSGFVFQASALVMVLRWVVRRPHLVLPFPLPLLVGFLLVVPASLLQLDDGARIAGAAWRVTTYLGCAVWFVWLYNHGSIALTKRLVTRSDA